MSKKHPDTLQLRFRNNNERHQNANEFLRNCGNGNATAAVVLLVEFYIYNNPVGIDMEALKELKKETKSSSYVPQNSILEQKVKKVDENVPSVEKLSYEKVPEIAEQEEPIAMDNSMLEIFGL